MLKKYLNQNYLTTIFGILAGLPVLVATSLSAMSVTMSTAETRILGFVGAFGLIGLGIVAKAVNVHSTEAQVVASTAVVTGDPKAPMLVKAADEQIAAKK